MIQLSYLSPKTEVRESKIHGRGLFAIADIAKNEIVAVKGGHIVDRKTLREKITPLLGPVEIQIDDRSVHRAGDRRRTRSFDAVFKSLMRPESRGARRDHLRGDARHSRWRRTHTRLGDDRRRRLFHECNCGAPDCRKILTGKDWQRPDLQKRYAGYFSAYLARKIALLEVRR